jgi:prephenate dehydratase
MSVTAVGTLSLGALGGPDTFGGQAAAEIVARYPEFSEVVYLENSQEAFGETGSWRTSASCVPEQTSKTGFHVTTQRRVAVPPGKLFVLAEMGHAYRCSLLVKPGSDIGGIRRVLGHTGSINQSRTWLAENVPTASVEVVTTHSMGAGVAVADGDGSVAAVGTPELADRLGLEQAATQIDGGSVGHYWAVSPHALFASEPTRLVVAGRSTGDGSLSRVVASLQALGFYLRTIWTEAAGDRLFHYQVVAVFVGSGELAAVETALRRSAGDLWIAGAFVSPPDGTGVGDAIVREEKEK